MALPSSANSLPNGKGVVSAIDSEITVPVGSGGSYQTIQQAVDGLRGLIVNGGKYTINPTGHMSVDGAAIAEIDTPQGAGIEIIGQTPQTATLTGITSVTGSAGAWVVTATVDDGTKFAIGDVALVKSVRPGVYAPNTFTGLPAAGELRFARYRLGEFSCTGTTAALSLSSATDYMANGYLVIVKGQVRAISSLSGSGFTMSAALDADVPSDPGLIGWWYTRPSTGTISISGTAVTGSGTAFDTELNVGDLIAVDTGRVARVSAIASATALTLEYAPGNVSSKTFGAIVLGECHEGGWLVTNVVGNSVTWTHTGRISVKPPVVGITSGTITILKTVITQEGDYHGFAVSSAIYLNNIAIIGEAPDNSCNGIELRGPDANGRGSAILGSNVAILGFNYSVYSNAGCTLYASAAAFTGADLGGVHVRDGATAYLVNAIAVGNNGDGIRCEAGSYVKGTGVRAFMNDEYGAWVAGPAHGWFESSYFESNGSDGSRVVHTGGAVYMQSRFIGNRFGGCGLESGGQARFSFCFVAGNDDYGIYSVGPCTVEAEDIQVMGNEVGWYGDGGEWKFEQGAFTGNGRDVQFAYINPPRVNDLRCTIGSGPKFPRQRVILDAGPGTSLTGSTTETALASYTFDGLKRNTAYLEINTLWITTGSNTKVIAIRLGGTASTGTLFLNVNVTTNTSTQVKVIIRQDGSFTAQVAHANNTVSTYSGSTAGVATGSVDMSTTQTLWITGDMNASAASASEVVDLSWYEIALVA